MEWVAEGVTMIFIGALVAGVTINDHDSSVSLLVYRMAAVALVAFAVLTSFTGARTPVAWFKACPLVMTVCAALLVIGSSL